MDSLDGTDGPRAQRLRRGPYRSTHHGTSGLGRNQQRADDYVGVQRVGDSGRPSAKAIRTNSGGTWSITSAQLSAFLMTTRLRTLNGTAANRAASLKSLVDAQFPGVRWNVVAKRAPGGFGNWAVKFFASASFSSGWITDDGDDYNYIVWATSTFNAPPTANPGGPYVVAEGSPISFNAGGSTDPEGKPLEFRWDFNGDGIWDTTRSA